MNDQPSNHALARQLHRASLELLNERLKASRVPVELLQVVRRFLRDSGLLGAVADAVERERLEAMYAQYITRLEEALQADRPSAAVLMEARKFLVAQGADRTACSTADGAPSLADIADADLPFQ